MTARIDRGSKRREKSGIPSQESSQKLKAQYVHVLMIMMLALAKMVPCLLDASH